jgi:hypothetical protein
MRVARAEKSFELRIAATETVKIRETNLFPEPVSQRDFVVVVLHSVGEKTEEKKNISKHVHLARPPTKGCFLSPMFTKALREVR